MSIPTIAPYPVPTASELPQSRVRWKPDPQRAVLLVHDMQDYFTAFFQQGAPPLCDALSNMLRLRAASDRASVPIVFTAQPGSAEPASRGLLADMWGAGLLAHPEREAIVATLSPGPSHALLHKSRYSAFYQTELQSLLREWGRDQLWICGVYAHIGCQVTACDAFMRDIKPFLIADAVADFGRAEHDAALRQVATTCGVVCTTDALLQALGAGPAPGWQLLARELAALIEIDPDKLRPEDDLRELGLDSVRLIELVDRLVEHGVELDPADLLECDTAGRLCEAVTVARSSQ